MPELDLWDEAVLSLDVAEGIRRARAGEAAALAFDKRVTNSEGAVFGRTVGASAFATSAGFSGSVRGTHVSFAVEPLCDDADGKKRNGSYWTASPLRDAARDAGGGRARGGAPHGRQAGRAQDPDRRGAGDLLAGRGARAARAARGRDVGRRGLAAQQLPGRPRGDGRSRRRSSTIVDDPLMRRGPGSRPFDGEGLAEPHERAGRRRACCARSCATSTRRASSGGGRRARRRAASAAARTSASRTSSCGRGARRRPSCERIDRGLYVTDLMGFGFNARDRRLLAGRGRLLDREAASARSRSARSPSRPTSTSCGRASTRVGDDLDTRSSVQCPTFRVSEHDDRGQLDGRGLLRHRRRSGATRR